MAKTKNSTESGCYLIYAIIGLIGYGIYQCSTSNGSEASVPTTSVSAYQSPQIESKTIDGTNNELSEEDKQYIDNSLSTGATPYADFYGKNYICPYDQCSGIKVTAPHESDIIVIIKRDNSNGEVITHGYIKAGDTYVFPIPDGTYQTFFYYGEGWNPYKKITDNIQGGFVKNEIFSKDNPQKIYSGILTYVLQLQYDGNFQTKDSNRNEIF